MARLFTGIPLPASVTQQLILLQSQPTPGLRLVKAEQMHLTLHFIGEGDVEAYRQALDEWRVPAFTMTIESLGKFFNRQGTILWAGLRYDSALMRLHKELESTLQAVGYRPEKRSYHPHLTLARGDHRVPRKVIETFLGQKLEPMEVKVEEVVLFSSILSDQWPRHQREAVVKLDSP